MLVGSYGSLVMEDGSIKIPKKFQNDLKGKLVVTVDVHDGCVVIIPINNLSTIQHKSKTGNEFKTLLNNSEIYIMENPEILKIDAIFLRSVGITRECVFLGMQDYVELWDKEKFNTYFTNLDKDSVKEELLRRGF